ncbi:hypothetical protein ACJENK_25920, partial [Escherichia coli]
GTKPGQYKRRTMIFTLHEIHGTADIIDGTSGMHIVFFIVWRGFAIAYACLVKTQDVKAVDCQCTCQTHLQTVIADAMVGADIA